MFKTAVNRAWKLGYVGWGSGLVGERARFEV